MQIAFSPSTNTDFLNGSQKGNENDEYHKIAETAEVKLKSTFDS